MTELARMSISKLNNSNYQVWKFKVELLLIKEGLWAIVENDRPTDPDDVWTDKDGKARATIGLLVEDGQLSLIRKCSTAKEMWISLKNYHQKSTLSNKVNLLKRLCGLKLHDDEDMEEHINKMTNLIDQLSALGANLADELTVALLLSSLPESYGTLITALETRPEADLTQELVKNKILEEYNRRKENTSNAQEKAFKINSGVPSSNRKRNCFFCKKPGHDKAECTKYKVWLQKRDVNQSHHKDDKDSSHKANKVSQVDQAVNIPHTDTEEHSCFMTGKTECTWYIDSGATSHMTSNLSFFKEIDNTIRERIYLADGRTYVTAGKGDGFLFCKDDHGKVREILVKDVLYIPELYGNLLSVKRIVEKGLEVNFNQKHCTIKKDGKVIAIAAMKNSLYAIESHELRIHHALRVTESGSFCNNERHKRQSQKDTQAIRNVEQKELVTRLKPRKRKKGRRRKQDDKEVKMNSIGYQDESKANPLLDPMTDKIVVDRNVQLLAETIQKKIQEVINDTTSKESPGLNFKESTSQVQIILINGSIIDQEEHHLLREHFISPTPLERSRNSSTKGPH